MIARVSILGVPVDSITRRAAVEQILAWVTEETQRQVATPNPEMLVDSARSPAFKSILNRTDLNLPDGTGVLWAARRSGFTLPERVTGVDVMMDVCTRLSGVPVFLLGAFDNTAERAAHALGLNNPGLVIAGAYAGSPRPEDDAAIVGRINASAARVLFVAYGAPKQELWIARNLPKMPGVKVAMGVGGSFDFIAGIKPRAPHWMRACGLEWLYRLLAEPRRIGRIFTAVVTFPVLVLRAGAQSASVPTSPSRG